MLQGGQVVQRRDGEDRAGGGEAGHQAFHPRGSAAAVRRTQAGTVPCGSVGDTPGTMFFSSQAKALSYEFRTGLIREL